MVFDRLKDFDFFGFTPQFYYRGYQTYRSRFGGTVFIILFMFGISDLIRSAFSVFNRDKLIVTSQNLYNNDAYSIGINSNDFPVMVNL